MVRPFHEFSNYQYDVLGPVYCEIYAEYTHASQQSEVIISDVIS